MTRKARYPGIAITKPTMPNKPEKAGYKEYKNLYVKSKIPHMILNVINLLILIIGIHYGIM